MINTLQIMRAYVTTICTKMYCLKTQQNIIKSMFLSNSIFKTMEGGKEGQICANILTI